MTTAEIFNDYPPMVLKPIDELYTALLKGKVFCFLSMDFCLGQFSKLPQDSASVAYQVLVDLALQKLVVERVSCGLTLTIPD